MKDRYYIPVSNQRFRRTVNWISGIMKEISYRLVIRKKCKIEKVKIKQSNKSEIKKYYSQFGLSNIDTYEHGYFAYYSGIQSAKYIPNSVFFRYIQPALNKLEYARAYADKNTYHRYSDIIRVPKTIICSINGKYYDGNHQLISKLQARELLFAYSSKIIVKPSIDSGAGKSILVFDNGKLSESAFDEFGKDFIVQEYMRQCDMLKKLYPDAVATLRVMTLHIEDEIYSLRPHLRIGNTKARYIKPGTGGFACGIHEDGNLYEYAYGKNNEIAYEHPVTKIPFAEVKVPQINKVFDKVKAMHRRLPYFKVVSWDIGIDYDDEPFLIEFNLMFQGINIQQMCYGPLFMEHTDKILHQVLMVDI